MSAQSSTERLMTLLETSKKQLLQDYKVLDEKEFSKLLTQNSPSSGISLKNLKERQEVLYFISESELLYPRFQLTHSFRFYDKLREILPTLYQKLSGWDIGFWLTRHQTIELFQPNLSEATISSLVSVNESIDEIANVIGDKLRQQKNTLSAKPLDLIRNNDERIDLFFEDLLLGDSREIPNKYLP